MNDEPSSRRQRLNLAICCGSTVLLSAFLLFQVQPLISKIILPWFGGSPAVWTTCMLFFQVLLLCGYTYAHFLVRLPSFLAQAAVHTVLVAAALAVLPITPDSSWQPEPAADPRPQILMILAVSVGLPFFVLSATAPLLQAWYSRALEGSSPYRLYALSNAGSLTALLSFPFLFEPWLTSRRQDQIWSITFAVFALLCISLCGLIWTMTRNRVQSLHLESELSEGGKRQLRGYHLVAWLLLPAFASMLLLAVTNHVCQDVAVVPFFWVVPLSLYLLSFIICFDSESWYQRRLFAPLAAVVVVLISVLMMEDRIEDLFWERWELRVSVPDYLDDLVFQAAIYLVFLFLLCMLCHGELVRLKPPTRHLTSYYLSIAAGGALGGIFVALICTRIFRGYWELHLGLMGGFLLAALVLWLDGNRSWLVNRNWLQWAGAFLAAGGAMLVGTAQWEALDSPALVAVRNFYGVLRVEDFHNDFDPSLSTRALYNGRILHGIQLLDAEDMNEPASYYHRDSGVGVAMRRYPRAHPWRVAVIGLGTGNMAVYGEPGDFYRFYEINPAVPGLARRYFTFLASSQADVDIALGDARLTMEREEPQQYDIIVLDAFSGDAIPTHLLTKEALDVYTRHLQAGGIIAIHISNLHLDLVPVVVGLAEYGRYEVVKIVKYDDEGPVDATSDWMLLTRNREFLDDALVQNVAEDYEGTYQPVPLWTDQYSNLFRILY